MKKILVLASLIFVSPLIAAGQDKDKDVLHVEMTLVMGERSRDSNSTITTITVADNLLLYQKIYRQRHGKREPEHKQSQLKAKDKASLIKLIKDRKLLRTEQLEREEKPSGIRRYFSLSLKTDINGRKGFIELKGPRDSTEIKNMKLYKDAVALVKKIFVIISSADRTIAYQPPID